MEVNIHYREEILKKFFAYVKSGESFYVVGAPSVGKTRLLAYLMGDNPDVLHREESEIDREWVKKRYLGIEASEKTWLARVDMNRLKSENDWFLGFFEVLLDSVLEASHRCRKTDEIQNLEAIIANLSADVIESKDALKAHRLFEKAVNMLVHSYDIRLCFLFDEFDEIYKTMPRELFAHLRAIRDVNKYRVFYALFLRNLPHKLRDPKDNEGFYELISRNRLGLGPFSRQDTIHVLEQLENRHEIELSQDQREWVYTLSGGHPGLIHAIVKLFIERPNVFERMPKLEWCANQEVIQEEFRKIWIGLLEDERNGLLEFEHGNQDVIPIDTGKLLISKGLLKPTNTRGYAEVFSPLFKYWLSKQ